ncbi:MAG: UDP-glucose/GDP-mannose dehydrogenase family protein [Asgard group archaeon]|nr:UDP-glucose/GDP-mannose dehydrogenase family protein [Asgard group archaeon]
MKNNRISIAGTGYVGLVTGAVFADRNFKVVAIDIDQKKVNTVNKGETFFFEPNLDFLVKRVVTQSKNLVASTNATETIKSTDVTFICVQTPPQEDGSCDLSYIKQVAEDIGKGIAKKDDYHLVITKSTIVPGTTRNLVKEVIEKTSGKIAGKDFGLCMSPEFLREGQSVHDMIFPDRVIIGELDERSGQLLEQIYRNLYRNEEDDFTKNWKEIYKKEVKCPEIFRTTLETAECTKYANNSFLATKISFINEFANICEHIEGVDINNIAKGIGLDFRINPKFLRAGAGFGGSCFPKDVNAIITFAREKKYEPELLTSVLKINYKQARRMVEFVEQKIGSIKDKTISLLGLSFKPETDDMRNAPSIKIVNILLEKGAKVVGWDPIAIPEARKEEWIGKKITYAKSIEEAIKVADACLLITEWQVLKELKPKDFKQMKRPVLIDGRRIYNPTLFLNEGIEYLGIGLGLEKQ